METESKTVIVIQMSGRVDSVYGSTQAMRDDGKLLAPIADMIDDGADSGWHPTLENHIIFRVMRIR